MGYAKLFGATYLLSLVFGAAAAWIFTVDPRQGLLAFLVDWLIEWESVRSRYEVSVSFCGYCGDLYLLTLAGIVLLSGIYCAVLLSVAVRVFTDEGRHPSRVLDPDVLRSRSRAALGKILLAVAVLAAMIWSMLFSPDFVRPSRISPSSSEYAMFGFTLIFLVSTSFHFLVLALLPIPVKLAIWLSAVVARDR